MNQEKMEIANLLKELAEALEKLSVEIKLYALDCESQAHALSIKIARS